MHAKHYQYTKILLIGSNLWFLGEGMFGPMFAIFTEKIGGDILDVTGAWATYLIIAGLLYMIVGKITDAKQNKESVMVAGYALNTIFTFGYLFVTNPMQLFILQAGLGVATALASPTWYALYAKHEDKKHDGFQWALYGGTAQITTGLALLVGGVLVNYTSFDMLFFVMGCIQLLATIYQAKILLLKK